MFVIDRDRRREDRPARQ